MGSMKLLVRAEKGREFLKLEMGKRRSIGGKSLRGTRSKIGKTTRTRHIAPDTVCDSDAVTQSKTQFQDADSRRRSPTTEPLTHPAPGVTQKTSLFTHSAPVSSASIPATPGSPYDLQRRDRC